MCSIVTQRATSGLHAYPRFRARAPRSLFLRSIGSLLRREQLQQSRLRFGCFEQRHSHKGGGRVMHKRKSLCRSFPGANWSVGAAVALFGIVAWPQLGFAYRPFDGTDAAVAKEGEGELELQPAGILR